MRTKVKAVFRKTAAQIFVILLYLKIGNPRERIPNPDHFICWRWKIKHIWNHEPISGGYPNVLNVLIVVGEVRVVVGANL